MIPNERSLREMPRTSKVTLWLGVDTVLISTTLYAAYALRLETVWAHPMMSNAWGLFPLVTIVGLGAIRWLGLHRIRLHSFDEYALQRIGIASVVLTLTTIFFGYMLGFWVPRSVPIIFGATFFLMSVTSRLVALACVKAILSRKNRAIPVAIYGAGVAGIQLAAALRQSPQTRPIMFIDDNPALWGLLISGLEVRKPNALNGLAQQNKIRRVLLAMPSASQLRVAKITQALKSLDLDVHHMPSYADLVAGKGLTETGRALAHDALLGRDKVDLNIPDVAKTYAGRTVMVTGAGGSIGTELCRQLIDIRPARIVLFERSEFALYQIDRDLRFLTQEQDIEVITRLGSTVDAARMTQVLTETGTDIIFHAAAYKHVPLVEDNALEGARNNVIGTRVAADAAVAAGVERFILISTDKAVRPTNIMGATKRMAEMVIQDLQSRSAHTKFSMVRFGNVLGSSGSVLPLFESQIRRGGPVTVTHPEITRFFMTIPEAARLVLLAGTCARGADVFVLDMGKPMKIIDIARRIIELSGRRVKENGKGDIEIAITGLRPGEKLYEELLIDNNSLRATPHEKILRAEEQRPSQIEMAAMLRELNAVLDSGNPMALRKLIQARVEGYQHKSTVIAPAAHNQ